MTTGQRLLARSSDGTAYGSQSIAALAGGCRGNAIRASPLVHAMVPILHINRFLLREHPDLGPQQFGDDRHRDVIDGAG